MAILTQLPNVQSMPRKFRLSVPMKRKPRGQKVSIEHLLLPPTLRIEAPDLTHDPDARELRAD